VKLSKDDSKCHDYKIYIVKKGKAILVTGRVGPYGCEMSRLPYFLEPEDWHFQNTNRILDNKLGIL
jgi:hypothetical protein